MRVDQLGAYLEAYVKTIPVITALRMCNRFGTGDDCHINRLPVELVKLIEEHIVESEWEKMLPTWSQTLKCCEGNCEPLDHYWEDELYRLYHSTYGCANDGCETIHPQVHDIDECYHQECGGDKCPAWKYDSDSDLKIRKRLDELSDVPHIDLHDRCEMWLHDYAATLEEDGPFFKEIQELFTTHFGLCVWTGRLRFMPMGDMRHKIAAYLTLPNDTSRHDKWRSEYYQADNIDFGVPVNVGVSPTEQSLSRFSRALKILGIQAWTHPGLVGQPILSPPSIDSLAPKVYDNKDVAQPQFTFLVRNKLERDW